MNSLLKTTFVFSLLCIASCEAPDGPQLGEIRINQTTKLVFSSWSSHGDKIAALTASLPQVLCVLNADGSGPRVIGSTTFESLLPWGWLPGRNIVVCTGFHYVINVFVQGTDTITQFQLRSGTWLVNVASPGLDTLQYIPAAQWGLAVSSRFDSIAFVTDSTLYVSGVTGDAPRVVTDFATGQLRSQNICWDDANDAIILDLGGLYSYSFRTSTLTCILSVERLNETIPDRNWQIAELQRIASRPGGTHIAFSSLFPSFDEYTPPSYIYVFNRSDSTVVRFAEGVWPSWSPDGAWLTYNRGGNLYKRRFP